MTLTVEDIRDFQNRKAGWIKPDNSYVFCDYLKHFEVLGLEEKYQRYYEEQSDLDYEQVRMEEEDSEDEYYHPAWHRFDASGVARQRLYEELIDEGYVRIGLFTHSRKNYIEVEGKKSRFNELEKDFKFIKDVMEIDNIKYRTI